MVSFTLAMLRHLIRLALAPFTSFRLAKFGLVPFQFFCWPPYATPDNEAQRRIYGGCAKTPVLF